MSIYILCKNLHVILFSTKSVLYFLRLNLPFVIGLFPGLNIGLAIFLLYSWAAYIIDAVVILCLRVF